MKKTFLIGFMFIIMHTTLYATVDNIAYKATFGIFGTVGTIKNKITKTEKTYSIESKVTFAGLAKLLMVGQVEHYISKGHMSKGLMVSDSYTMISKKKNKLVKKEYLINHKDKTVMKRVRKWKNNHLVKDKKEKLDFYAKDDLLTLYFNLGTAVTEKGKKYYFKAVGLEKQKGKVQITVPSPEHQAAYEKALGRGATLYAKALIVQKSFKNKKGDILMSIAKDGYIQNTVIKDILFYGDAKIKRLKSHDSVK